MKIDLITDLYFEQFFDWCKRKEDVDKIIFLENVLLSRKLGMQIDFDIPEFNSGWKSNPSSFVGLSRLADLYCHLGQQDEAKKITRAILQNLTKLNYKEKYEYSHYFDMINGISGILVSLKNSDLDNKEIIYLADVLNKYLDFLMRGPNINLSFSHGISGIAFALSRIEYFDASKTIEKVIGILEKSVFHRISETVMISKAGNILSYRPSSRCSWCYGEIGILLAALEFDKRGFSNSITNDVFAILHKNARHDRLDYSLCHGISGIIAFFDIFNLTKTYINLDIEDMRLHLYKIIHEAIIKNKNIYLMNRWSILEGIPGALIALNSNTETYSLLNFMGFKAGNQIHLIGDTNV